MAALRRGLNDRAAATAARPTVPLAPCGPPPPPLWDARRRRGGGGGETRPAREVRPVARARLKAASAPGWGDRGPMGVEKPRARPEPATLLRPRLPEGLRRREGNTLTTPASFSGEP